MPEPSSKIEDKKLDFSFGREFCKELISDNFFVAWLVYFLNKISMYKFYVDLNKWEIKTNK